MAGKQVGKICVFTSYSLLQLFKTATNTPLSLKYNTTLLKIKEIVMKHWHLLHINPSLAEMFQNPPIFAFRRNKNLRDIIGTKLIENGKVKRKFTNKIQSKCTPCLVNNRSLCCKQIVHTTTFRSNQTNRIFRIYHNLNCKSMSCTCWTAPSINYNTLEKQKLNSTLDSITTKKMYGNQML